MRIGRDRRGVKLSAHGGHNTECFHGPGYGRQLRVDIVIADQLLLVVVVARARGRDRIECGEDAARGGDVAFLMSHGIARLGMQ